LLGYASGKTLMMQVFTKECVTQGLPGFEHEDRDEEHTEEEDDESVKRTAAKKTKVQARGSKDPKPDVSTAQSGADTDPPAPDTAPSSSKPTGKKTPAPRKTKAAKYIHEQFPELGPRPREGTKARTKWEKKVTAASLQKMQIEKQIRAEVEAEVTEKIVARAKAHLERTAQTSLDNAMELDEEPASGAPASEPTDSAPPTKGKDKARESEQPGSTPLAFTPLQTTFIQMIGNGSMTVEAAQQALQSMNEPPLPASVLPDSNAPQASGSASGMFLS
jgi:hypothetical protein